MQIFPKNSPFYEMPEPIKAAVIKYVFDMGEAGKIDEMDLGSPVLRPVFRQVGRKHQLLHLVNKRVDISIVHHQAMAKAQHACVSSDSKDMHLYAPSSPSQNAPFFFTLAGAGSLLWAVLAPSPEDDQDDGGGGDPQGRRRRIFRRLPMSPYRGDPAFARFARAMLINVCFVCLLQLLLLLPFSLFVLLVHNWVLGAFLCYALTMIQVSTKTALL